MGDTYQHMLYANTLIKTQTYIVTERTTMLRTAQASEFLESKCDNAAIFWMKLKHTC